MSFASCAIHFTALWIGLFCVWPSRSHYDSVMFFFWDVFFFNFMLHWLRLGLGDMAIFFVNELHTLYRLPFFLLNILLSVFLCIPVFKWNSIIFLLDLREIIYQTEIFDSVYMQIPINVENYEKKTNDEKSESSIFSTCEI